MGIQNFSQEEVLKTEYFYVYQSISTHISLALTGNFQAKEVDSLRSLMPALASKTYFNYGGQGPLPTSSLDAITASWQKIQELGPFTNKVWPYVASEIQATRNQLAKECGVSPNRVGLTENVTSGCILPLWGLPFCAGEHFLISDCEHPGVIAGCKEIARRKEINIDILPIQSHLREGKDNRKDTENSFIELIGKHLHQKTCLIVISHVLWNTGQLIPINNISELIKSHPKKPYLLVDAAQSFAQIPLKDVANVADIYAFTGHKWACGPEGLGGMVLSNRILQESKPTLIGWRSLYKEGHSLFDQPNKFHKDSRRFEVATSCIPLLAGLRNSLNLLNKEGDTYERLSKILKLSANLWKKLNSIDGIQPLLKGEPPSGLVSFMLPENHSTKDIVNLLGRKELWLRDIESPICLRACLHITSEENEINQLIIALSEIIKA